MADVLPTLCPCWNTSPALRPVVTVTCWCFLEVQAYHLGTFWPIKPLICSWLYLQSPLDGRRSPRVVCTARGAVASCYVRLKETLRPPSSGESTARQLRVSEPPVVTSEAEAVPGWAGDLTHLDVWRMGMGSGWASGQIYSGSEITSF